MHNFSGSVRLRVKSGTHGEASAEKLMKGAPKCADEARVTVRDELERKTPTTRKDVLAEQVSGVLGGDFGCRDGD